MSDRPDFETLVADVSDAFSCDWDVGTDVNHRLAATLAQLVPQLVGVSPRARAHIVAVVIEDRMHLDTDEDGLERIEELVTPYFRS